MISRVLACLEVEIDVPSLYLKSELPRAVDALSDAVSLSKASFRSFSQRSTNYAVHMLHAGC